MRNAFQRILLLIGVAFAVTVTVVLINQLVQLARVGFAVSDWLGWAIAVGLGSLYVAAIGYPVLAFLRLPNRLKPPSAEDEAAVADYKAQLGRRLKRHYLLRDQNLDTTTDAGREAAMRILDEHATREIKDKAGAVFISTAISQNGRLDALLVLIGLSRLVWRVAHIYQERPNWREILSLYNNVVVTALLASQIEDLNVDQQIEPIVRSALGSGLAGMVPGATPITTILLSSVLEGTANAFLTLRVGLVTKNYCASTIHQPKRAISRLALVQATNLLGGIVYDATKVLSAAVTGAVRNAGTGVFQNLAQGFGDVVSGKMWTADKPER